MQVVHSCLVDSVVISESTSVSPPIISVITKISDITSLAVVSFSDIGLLVGGDGDQVS